MEAENVVKRQESSADKVLKHILHLDEKDLRLKLIFDHVRNYGIAASVLIAGFYLISHGAVVSQFPGAGIVFGVLLLFAGVLLMVFNLLQPIWLMANYKVKMIPYFVASIIMFLAASELVWVIVKKSI